MKGKRPHVVPLSPMTVMLLDARRRQAPTSIYVLEGVRAKRLWSGLGEQLPALAAPWIPHDLRRTAATGMGRIGVSSFVIARVLAHADLSVTAVYNRHEHLPEKTDALDRWARELQRVINPAATASASVLRHRPRRA